MLMGNNLILTKPCGPPKSVDTNSLKKNDTSSQIKGSCRLLGTIKQEAPSIPF